MATMWDDWVRNQGMLGSPAMPDATLNAQPGFNMPIPSMTAGRFNPPAAPPMAAPRQIAAAPMMAPPMPPPRPTEPGAPMQLASAAPSVRESFMQRLLRGPEYQSNSLPVIAQPQGPTPSGAALPPMMQAQTPQQINFGNPDNPADFVRADRALMGLPEEALRVAGLLG